MSPEESSSHANINVVLADDHILVRQDIRQFLEETADIKVLAEAGEALNCKQMVEKVMATGLWKTSGKTPAATLYSAILRECQTKGDSSRFRKADRGLFELNR